LPACGLVDLKTAFKINRHGRLRSRPTTTKDENISPQGSINSVFKIKFVNLGCSKNLVDSERMAGMLKEAGGQIVEDAEEADGLVVNTCSFIEAARAEAVDTILSGAVWKKHRKGRKLFVAGCLPQRYDAELKKEFPEADGYFGAGDYSGLVKAIIDSSVRPSAVQNPRYAFTPKHYRYLRIADGCDRNCAYCAIPAIRGKYHSQSIAGLVTEARSLAEEGAKELIIIAQEINSYGADLTEEADLMLLLRQLVKIDGLRWIRMLYLHPPLVENSLVELIAGEKKICPYFDFPIEHINDKILRRMGRKINRREIEAKLKMIKSLLPQAAIRTSLMTGFPGEGEDEFAELLDFVAEEWFDHLGVFTYSPEEGTSAFYFPNRIPQETAQFRLEAIMDLQCSISAKKNQAKIGKVYDVIVDGNDEEGALYGRNQFIAPEIDGKIFIQGSADAGELVRVKIRSAGDYDLLGEIVKQD